MEYDAVVYDLDNTLVRLVVDWEEVASDVAAALRERDVEPPDDLWTMLEHADEAGHRDAVEAAIADHEWTGARSSELLDAADLLPHDIPVAVCSLNCEKACHLALERHELDGHVTAVVGRDSGPWEKPEPEPLLEAIDALDAEPARTLFVGDSERDEQTAKNAGVPFCYVSEWLRA